VRTKDLGRFGNWPAPTLGSPGWSAGLVTEVRGFCASSRIMAATSEASLALRKLLIGLAAVLMH